MTVTKKQIIDCLSAVSGLPRCRRGPGYRAIYEAGKGPQLKPSGHFYIDYASFPGGIAEEISRGVIDQLEKEGRIMREFSDATINAWVLIENGPH